MAIPRCFGLTLQTGGVSDGIHPCSRIPNVYISLLVTCKSLQSESLYCKFSNDGRGSPSLPRKPKI